MNASGWSTLVEREREREQIGASLAGSQRGHGRFVIVYGPSGVGRSRVLQASVLEAHERGIAVLEACGSELERGYGFGMVRQLLEAPIAGVPTAEWQSLLGGVGPAAESALGIAHVEPGEAGSAFEQIEGVHRLITRLGARRPLLVAVDDLQWCDRPSLDFLCFLGHRVTRLPVTVIAAWRRGEPGVRAGRLQALAGKPDTLFLSPGPFSHDGIRAVVRRETGTDPDDQAVAAIHARTGGQPLLVSELVAGLRLRGVGARGAGRDAIEEVTPESVRRDIVARLGRHAETVQRFARAVAVIGNASLAQAAALAAIDEDKARVAVAALVRAGILRDDATVAYAYPLQSVAVYDTLSSLERSELHRRAAGLLYTNQAGADLIDRERVVRHLLCSEPGDDPRFAQVLLDAARLACEAGSVADARRYLTRALGEIDDRATRSQTLVQLAELELRAHEVACARSHAGEALSLVSELRQRVAASLVSAQAMAASAGVSAALELLETESLSIRGRDPELDDTMTAAAVALRVCANLSPCESPDATMRLERLVGESPAQRALLAACASDMVARGVGTASRVRKVCARALGGGGEPLGAGFSDIADYLAGRAAVLADADDLLEAQGPPDAGGTSELARLAIRSQLALVRGELPAAEADARAALALIDDHPLVLHRRIRSDLLAALVVIGIERGRLSESGSALAELCASANAPAPAVSSLRIALALAQGIPDDAVAALAQAAVADEPGGLAVPGLSWRPWAALAHHASGDHDRALALATDHLAQVSGWGAPRLLGHALVVRGMVDPGQRRLQLIEDAVALLPETSAKLELARACVELGVALRRARRRSDARVALARGADLAHGCGATALAARARAELVAVGARPRRAAFSGLGSLTLGELRVARLAATGRTNREIAGELVVSAKTVSSQLTAVYRKLDVHDRTALAAVMGQSDRSDQQSGGRAVGLVG